LALGEWCVLAFENGDASPPEDVWRDISRPDAFAPLFACNDLEITPGIHFHAEYDGGMSQTYITLRISREPSEIPSTNSSHSISAVSSFNYGGLSSAPARQEQSFDGGSVTLCAYGGYVYLDGTVVLRDETDEKNLGIFHLTATAPQYYDIILESRRLG
jgi:hypothetical protein